MGSKESFCDVRNDMIKKTPKFGEFYLFFENMENDSLYTILCTILKRIVFGILWKREIYIKI